MQWWKHALGVIAGVGAPVATTLYMTSDYGPRSKAHYAELERKNAKPEDVVMAFEKLAFDERRPQEAVMRYFAADSVDHDPNVRGDRDSVIELLNQRDWSKAGPTRAIKHVVADKDIVMIHHHIVREPGTKGVAAVDIFRVKDGKIVEHWDVLQPIPENSPNRYGSF